MLCIHYTPHVQSSDAALHGDHIGLSLSPTNTHMKLPLHRLATRDVNETQESRVSFFFLGLGKLPRIETSDRPAVGLWSPILGVPEPVGDRDPCCIACLLFDRCTTAPETRPLPAVLRAHPPATSTDCPAVSDREGKGRHGNSLTRRPRDDRPLRVPGPAPPVAPSRFATFWVRHHWLC